MSFRIIHLSDLHIGHPRDEVDQHDVLRPLIKHIEETRERLGQEDLIVFSGDLVYGEEDHVTMSEQLALARTVVSEISAAFATPVFMVPGNHDVNRTLVDEAHRDWIHARIGTTGSDEVSEAQQTGSLVWQGILRRQEEWWQEVTSWPLPWSFDPSMYVATGFVDHSGRRIGLGGFNSAWGCSEDGEEGKLWVGRHQFQVVDNGLSGCDFRIAIMHHPPTVLREPESTWLKERLETRYDVFLHGHLHHAWPTSMEGHLISSAGAAYQGSTKDNGYSWVELDFDHGRSRVHMFEYRDKGAGGWVPSLVPGRTEDGVHTSRSPFEDSASAYAVGAGGAAPKGIPLDSISPDVVPHFLKQFDFRFEPNTIDLSSDGVVCYWPVRLRAPTPIHAVQSFAVAALQTRGVRTRLCVDDFGTTEYRLEMFSPAVERWLQRVGVPGLLEPVNSFTDILADADAQRIWDLVQAWLGESHYRLADVLSISKLVPAKSTLKAAIALEDVLQQRPRRLLTPVLVWTALLWILLDQNAAGALTFGGYDERPLWRAWREINKTDARVGHLYAPELRLSEPSTPTPLHMRDGLFEWHAEEDIRADLMAFLDGLEEARDWRSPNYLLGWCLNGLVLLPRAVAGESGDLTIGGVAIHDLSSLSHVTEPRAIVADLSAEIGRWLL